MDLDTSKSLELKKKKPGIVYLSSVPYEMSISGIKAYFTKFCDITNIFFQQAGRENYVGGKAGSNDKLKKTKNRRRGLIKGKIRYTEGWIEFSSKRKAKWIADMFNNNRVGGKKTAPYYDCLWSIKYIGKGFKWAHLRQRIEHEKEIHKRKMKNETRKITEQAEQYIKAAELAERLEKKGKLGKLGSSGGGDMAEMGVKQRLTEAQILKKQKEKKLKDQKFKSKIKKSKLSKQKKKVVVKEAKLEQVKSFNMFVGGGDDQ